MITAGRPVTPHSILAAKLEWLHDQLDGMNTSPEFAAELRTAVELAVGLDPYLEMCTSPESVALRQLAERTRTHGWADTLEREMLSGHVEGQFLKMLVRLARARTVLDIGMFTGYSALAMAEAVHGVAGAAGRVVACEIDPDAADAARAGFAGSPAGHLVDVRIGPALSTLRELSAAGDWFDVIFLDADKPSYLDYLGAVLDGDLLADHGVICVDNTLMQGDPWTSGGSTTNGAAIDAFNRAVADDPRLEQVLVPLRDGLTLIRKVGT